MHEALQLSGEGRVLQLALYGWGAQPPQLLLYVLEGRLEELQLLSVLVDDDLEGRDLSE